ncbi:uncharacterized protein [Branchiostoma lanceolatum]|uniref:uncharacterized protein n=1 Tax=Branchiostoma lanceolatum TaxID=7740 RepID=UPI0034551B72
MSISLTQGRFFAIQKTESHNRKHISVLNKIERKRTDFLTRQLEKTRQAEEYRVKQQRQKLTKSLSNIEGLRRGLMRKLSLQSQSQNPYEGDMSSNYGRYGGMTLDAIKKDTDRWYKPKDPKVERMKKSQDLLREGRRDGRIIAYESLPAILSLPEQRKEEERRKREEKRALLPETPEKSPEYDHLPRVTEKTRSSHFETVRKRRRDSISPRLKLPPLKDFKDMKKDDAFSLLKPRDRDDRLRFPSLGNRQETEVNNTGKRDAATETDLPPVKSHKSGKGNNKSKTKQWNKGAHGALPPLIES